MNYVLARSQYAQSQMAQAQQVTDPHEIVAQTMYALRNSLRAISHTPGRGPSVSKHFSKAFTAIYILQSSLDFDQGGEIASNLFKLYEYIRQELLKAFSAKPGHQVSSCVVFMDEIIEAWDSIR